MCDEECGGRQKGDESANIDTYETRSNVQPSTLEVDYDVGYCEQNENPMLSPITVDNHSAIDPSSCVQVAVRVRPLLALEGDDVCCVQVIHNGTKGPTKSRSEERRVGKEC